MLKIRLLNLQKLVKNFLRAKKFLRVGVLICKFLATGVVPFKFEIEATVEK